MLARLIKRTAVGAVTFCLGIAALPALAGEFPAEWHWGDAEQQKKLNELVGKPMPELKLDDWRGGEVSAENMKGKVIVVDFWATWCGPCLAAIPHNNGMYERYKDQGLVLIGVCGSSRGQERMEETADKHGIAYPIAKDPTNASATAWRVMWWPTYGLVDRAGNLRALGLKPDFVDDVVEKLLKETAPADETTGIEDVAPVVLAMNEDAPVVQKEWLEGDEGRRATLAEIEGKAAPALAVKEWTNGDATSLDQLRGKVVMLDFWATWCGPCIAAIPHTNELMTKYGDQGLVIVGVCHSEGAEKMAAVVKEKGIAYAVAADVDGQTVKGYRVDSYPDYYFIDRAGNLRIADCKNGSIEQAIEALLAEPAPDQTAMVP